MVEEGLIRDAVAEVKPGWIMLSYNWKNQQTVLRIHERLSSAGYATWIDVERMAGSTDVAMSQAVEGAAVVVGCLSQDYRDSKNCRKEYIYASEREVDFIPLMMDRPKKAGGQFDPTGPLGLLLGSRLWVPFWDEADFEESIQALIAQLDARGLAKNFTVEAELDFLSALTIPSDSESESESDEEYEEEEEEEEDAEEEDDEGADLLAQMEQLTSNDAQSGREGALEITEDCKYNFFLSKHEEHKFMAKDIARELRGRGFLLWLSQDLAAEGEDIDREAMQKGVRESAALILLLSHGVYHRDRNWVTHAEVKYAIELGKPILCIGHQFDITSKCHALGSGCVHPLECCENVAEDFQPYARAIYDMECVSWFTDPAHLAIEVDKIERFYRERRESAAAKLQRAVERQLHCGVCSRASEGD